MPKNNRAIKIDFQKRTERRLIDSKVLKRQKSGPLRKLLIFIAALAVLIGGGVIGYAFFSGKEKAETKTPEIIVPEEIPAVAEEEKPEPVVTRQITIMDTPIGYLNVRKGPGTTFEKIGQVKPGEIYDLVSENPEKTWYEIKFSAVQTGWVIKEYAKEE